jgi:hypothetical protein
MTKEPVRTSTNGAMLRWSIRLMVTGALFVAAQLVAEYGLRYKIIAREPPIFPFGLVIVVVGAALLAYAAYCERQPK